MNIAARSPRFCIRKPGFWITNAGMTGWLSHDQDAVYWAPALVGDEGWTDDPIMMLA